MRFRLRPALMRFAEPVRSLADPAGALERLMARGEVEPEDVATRDEDGEDA